MEDYLSSTVLCRRSHRIDIDIGWLSIEADIAVFIGEAALQQGDVYGERAIAEIFFVIDFDDINEFVFGGFVHFSAAMTRVDKGAEADMGQQAGTLRSNLSHELHTNAARQDIGFDFVVFGKLLHSR